MSKGFRVAPVEGRLLLDPHTIGRTHRRIGYSRVLDGEVRHPITGEMVPRETWQWHGDNELVLETSDHYVRRAIVAGDVDYVGSVDFQPSGIVELPSEPELVEATARNVAARGEAPKAAPIKSTKKVAADAAG